MKVNLAKTKIVVFRKGGFLKACEKWKYGTEGIEVMNCYKYLGLHFTTRLSLTRTVGELANKAKIKTSQIFRCLWKLGQVPRDVFFKIYDAQIVPILLYGSELWGYQRFEQIEKAHLFACKRFLNVGWQTPNKMIYGDLCRYPMYITSAIRCIKYWIRVVNLPEDRLPKKAYRMLHHLQNSGKKTWAYHVSQILCANGFQDVWDQGNVGDLSAFICLFRQRLISRFHQEWSDSVSTSERFEFYASFKTLFVTEKYFDCEQLRCFREAYTRFRFGISPINVHKLRYKSGILPRHLLCPVCKHEIEDEAHVLFSCQGYDDLRSNFQVFSQHDEGDVAGLMNACDEESVKQLSKYLYNVFSKRKDYILP